MVSKPEIYGEQLIGRITGRNPDYGGILAQITGAQGTAKTSTLLSFTKNTIKANPHEKIFWREQTNAPIQIFKLGLENINFMIPKNGRVVFRDRDHKLEHVQIDPITEFTTLSEIYDLAEPGKANVIFFESVYTWMDFIEELREVGEWVNIFIDEMADIAPAVSSGKLHKKIRDFSGTMGAVRRCMMNVFYNTQTAQDIDWRVRKKIMMRVFLPGSIAEKNCRVTQKAIDNLLRDPVNGNEAYIDMGGEFGITKFADIFKPIPGYHIEAHITPKEMVSA